MYQQFSAVESDYHDPFYQSAHQAISQITFDAFLPQTFVLGDDYQQIISAVLFSPLPLILPKATLTSRDRLLRLWFNEQHPDAEDSMHGNAWLPLMGHTQEAHLRQSS